MQAKRIGIFIGILVLAVLACGTVPPATAVHIPTQVPAVQPVERVRLDGWNRRVTLDDECDYECQTYIHDSGALLQVYDDGFTLGLDLTRNPGDQGAAVGQATVYFGVPNDVNDAMMDMGDVIVAKGSGDDNMVLHGWRLALSLDDEGFMVMSFIYP